MYQTMHCVALRTVRYSDSAAMLTAWSAEAGRVSIAVPDGSGRSARRRRAMMMPLSLFEGEASARPGREAVTMRDMRPTAVHPDISADPAKALVAMFAAEILDKVLREAQPDQRLSEFIFDAVRRLDAARTACEVANYPIVFLYRLGHFLGIEPDTGSWQPGMIFDMGTAAFTFGLPGKTTLTAEESALLPKLARINFKTASRLRLPRQLRRRILAEELRYISLHHTSMDGLKAPAVVAEIF